MTSATDNRRDFKGGSSCRDASLYLAKSTNGDGWGVFSRYPVYQGQFIEVAPLFLRFPEDDPTTEKVLKDTMLNNYHYEYLPSYFVLSFGYMLYFNHSSSSPNIKYCQLGSEPDVDNLDNSVCLAYYAVCDIDAHVELLCDYGGSEWFIDRGIALVESENDVSANSDPSPTCSKPRHLFSKLYGGYNEKCTRKVIDCCPDNELDDSICDFDSLLSTPHFLEAQAASRPVSTGFGNVICRQDVKKGETLEVSPVLVLPKRSVEGSILEALTINWEDLECSQEVVSQEFTKIMIHQESDNDASITKVSSSTKEAKLNVTVILPLAGNLSFIARNLTDFNARMSVELDPFNKSGFLLRLEATKPLWQGDKITAALPPLSGALTTRVIEELALTGQPILCDLISE
jgi:hypothetical protein